MLELVTFGRFLRAAVQFSATFDFSLAHAMVVWIRQLLADPIEQSSGVNISSSVEALEAHVSLTSGNGLTAIWAALAPGISLNDDSSEVSARERADRAFLPSAYRRRMLPVHLL